MTTLLFATNNEHKIHEMQAAIGDIVEIISLRVAGLTIDIPEPHDTLEENAREKSRTIYALTGLSCFSEDTGLEVEALGGAPGVRSARYAGDGRSSDDNITKLLEELGERSNRKARFRTVISLIWKGEEYTFEGICNGSIIHQRKGIQGFGYDPVFVPDGATGTFAEMTTAEKNLYSHRSKAADLLVSFLQRELKSSEKA